MYKRSEGDISWEENFLNKLGDRCLAMIVNGFQDGDNTQLGLRDGRTILETEPQFNLDRSNVSVILFDSGNVSLFE